MSDPAIRHLTASDGVRLHFRHWAAKSEPRGTIVALHGIQSHSGWYTWSSGRLAAAGYSVYFADRRGSGLNGIQRGHADHGQRLLNDVRQLIQLARHEQSGAAMPLSLLAVSWGGRIAAALAATFPEEIDRLGLLYPGLIPRFKLSAWQRFRLHVARYLDVRFKGVDIPLTDPVLFTNVREHREFIAGDPLALHRVTSGFLNAGRDLDRFIMAGRDRITHPTLLMLAGQDQIIDNSATAQLASQFGSVRQTVIRYPDAQHTLEFDSNREQFVTDLIEWLSQISQSQHR